MILLFAILTLFHLDHVFSYVHKKALQPSILSERCTPKSWVLNDCNWCQCDENEKFQCAARPCSQVDMFGRFKDAIRDIEVGMEGHGSWRSTRTACSPGVNYRRNGLLCVCNKDGKWPNPVCRDIFRVLYSVKQTGLKDVTGNERCEANKLYLVGCNICYCPHTGYLNENLCTDMNCRPDDPILGGITAQVDAEDKTEDEEIYATCEINKEYLFGCRKCVCLRNNRLMCSNCSENIDNNVKNSYCDNNKVGEIFNIDCNSCLCDEMKNMICTTKKCLRSGSKEIKEIINMKGRMKDEYDDICASKQYAKGCNSCNCIKNENGENILDCTTKCDNNLRTIHQGCVKNTVYESNCMICYCYMRSNDQREFCVSNPMCHSDKALKEKRSQDLQSMHGYCEPFHTYKKECNICQCLADGKTLKCTSKICRASNRVRADIVPVRMQFEDCPRGRLYKVDCNLCFCLSNGNSVCTTLECGSINN